MCVATLFLWPLVWTSNEHKASQDLLGECLQTKSGRGLRTTVLTETNRVCCLKLIWRILSQTTLWVKSYLIRKGFFGDINEKTSLGS